MITKSQIGDLLTIITAFDRRTTGDADVEAWHLILSELEIDDCAQAVKDHYTESEAWLMPTHVHSRASKIRDRRIGQQKIAENLARDEAETRAIEAVPSEPVDHDAIKRQLAVGAANPKAKMPRVDRRPDSFRMAEARAEVERVRKAMGDEA